MLINFKNEFPFHTRLHEAKSICQKYPDRIPCIVESDYSDLITKKKYLIPMDLTIGQFVYIIRKRANISPEKAIFIFVNNIIPASSALISQVYRENKDEDFFLYFFIKFENTFGILN